MKARVKATGEIVEVSPYWTEIHTTNGGCYEMIEVELMPDVPDYWTRLEHTYAGMAMQAYIIASHISQFSFWECDKDMRDCKKMAQALVEKLKSESNG